MIFVLPMPDEFSAAHAGRFGSLNRLPTYRVQSALSAALTAEGHEIEDGMTMVEMLALASSMSSIAYAQAHSMLPALRVATKSDDIRPHGHPEDRTYTRRRGMMAPREGGFVCLKCVEKDLAGFGFSWFKRSHHLIGVDWCVEHGDPLWQVPGPDPFSALPHVWKARGQLRRLDACAQSLDEAAPFLHRFVAISASLLTHVQPISVTRLHRPIRERAAELGLRRALVGKQPPLSDLVRDLAPAEWVQAHVPGLLDKADSAYMSRIDDQLLSVTPASGDSYALAMAALFPSADEAIEAVLVSSQDLPSADASYRQIRGVQFWQGEVWQHYTKHRGDHREMADDIGLPVGYVNQRMLTLGLPDLREVGLSPLGAALSAFANGSTLEQACASNSVDEHDLQKLLRAACARLAKVVDHMVKEVEHPSLSRYRGMASSNSLNFSVEGKNCTAQDDTFDVAASEIGHTSIA